MMNVTGGENHLSSRLTGRTVMQRPIQSDDPTHDLDKMNRLVDRIVHLVNSGERDEAAVVDNIRHWLQVAGYSVEESRET